MNYNIVTLISSSFLIITSVNDTFRGKFNSHTMFSGVYFPHGQVNVKQTKWDGWRHAKDVLGWTCALSEWKNPYVLKCVRLRTSAVSSSKFPWTTVVATGRVISTDNFIFGLRGIGVGPIIDWVGQPLAQLLSGSN